MILFFRFLFGFDTVLIHQFIVSLWFVVIVVDDDNDAHLSKAFETGVVNTAKVNKCIKQAIK